MEWISGIHVHVDVIFQVMAMEAMGYWLNLQIFSLTLIVLSIVQVSQKVQESLTERAASFGLILDDISLVRIIYLYIWIYNSVIYNICVPLEHVKQDIWVHTDYYNLVIVMSC